jgi:hypothetical protein
MSCEEMNGLARRLMDDFHQRRDLESIRGKARELASAEAELAESNALFTEHRLTCLVCKDAKSDSASARKRLRLYNL